MPDELKVHNVELTDTRQQLAETKMKVARENATPARPNKPGLFSGQPGSIEAWCSHIDSYVLLSEPAHAAGTGQPARGASDTRRRDV